MKPDPELLKWAVENAGRGSPSRAPRWAHARNVFGVGSTSGAELCVRFKVNPDEMIGGCDDCETSYFVDFDSCACGEVLP